MTSLPIFNPINDLLPDQPIKLTLLKYGEKVDGTWGPYYPSTTVSFQGKIHSWNLKQDKKDALEALGIQENDDFTVTVWKKGVKSGYNFSLPTGDEGGITRQDLPPSAQTVDETQDRIIRCACFSGS